MYLKEKGLGGEAQIWASNDGNYIAVDMSLDMTKGPYDRDELAKWNRAKVSFYLNRHWAERLYKELGLAIDELIRNKRHKEEGITK
jgi:hypothetical protein